MHPMRRLRLSLPACSSRLKRRRNLRQKTMQPMRHLRKSLPHRSNKGNKTMNDAIIIGAGPAGTACAKKLAENGFTVKVYDKREEIGSPKRCAEGLTECSQHF